ncbi:hypothetical protein SDC9_76254 [bioreactor metagenome]|uniref:Uncharacterized protein n=1 Tax=bioreactor metagenome TaxID=1076179 RepID=A0A644YUL9_9ZZZZ
MTLIIRGTKVEGDAVAKILARQNGFLMLEVMLAVLIVSVALVAVLGMFINSTKANADAAENTVAATLAQKQLEMLKTKDHNYWANFAPNAQTSISWLDIDKPVPQGYAVNTVAMPCPENASLVQVTVTVTWNAPNSPAARNVKITTFYPKIPLY